MAEFNRIETSQIKEGIRFTAPVFFDDGKNMFLAEEKSVKPYHLQALKRWNIPYLLSYGHEMTSLEESFLKDKQNSQNFDEIEELEEVEELEELEEL